MFGRGDDSDYGASWWIRSKKDPRWDADGRCGHSIFSIEAAAREEIEKKTKTLGEPPDDLEMGGMKD